MMRTRWVALVVITVLLVPMSAFAGSLGATDWYLFPGGGTYSWSGGNSSLVGTNLAIQNVYGNGTPGHSGQTLSISNGLMNFTSGAYNGTLGSTWSWAGGGTFTLAGCIASVTSPTCTGSNNVTLLSDDFQSIAIHEVGKSQFDVVFGQIEGTLNMAVAHYFGLSNTPSFSMSNFTTVIDTTATPGNKFTGQNLGGMIDAVADPTPVSENWGVSDSLGLFALALVAFGVLTRLRVLRPVIS